MKLKRFLVVVSLVLLAINIPIIKSVLNKFSSNQFNLDATAVFYLMAAIIFVLIGQWLRMLRTKIIINQVAIGGVRGQFAALSVGYFFNAITPFRIGEILRSYLISSRLQISFLYTFVAIMIERLIDVIFICVVALLLSFFISANIAFVLLLSATTGLIISIILLSILFLLSKENKKILSLVWLTTNLFNKKIQNSLRFKIWSLIYGLQRFLANRPAVLRYLTLAFLSWLCLLVATGIIADYFFELKGIPELGAIISEPYIAVTSLVGSLGVDVYISNATKVLSSLSGVGSVKEYLLVVWFVLIVPMAVLGLISVFLFDWKRKKREVSAYGTEAYTNKLSRQFDLSQEFPTFLDSYFKGNSLSRILHKIEIDGNVSLVKFFKGGSDAVTMLALKNGNLFVKKVVSLEYEERLKAQHDWLALHNDKSIVKVLREDKNELFYAIDLEYFPGNISSFEYVHSHSLAQSRQMLDKAWGIAFTKIYKNLKDEKTHTKKVNSYIDERLIKRVEYAASVSPYLKEALRGETIIINGEVHYNFYRILDLIRTNKNAWQDISTYRESSFVHGDFTLDNIMVNSNTGAPYIIDPSDDNQIKGPVLDFGRLMQSLSYGYEFLCSDDAQTQIGYSDDIVSLKFNDQRSARYMQLDEYVKNKLVPEYLTEREARSIDFHAALFYGRMLTHRIHINPENVLKFYATSIIALNKFYKQYSD